MSVTLTLSDTECLLLCSFFNQDSDFNYVNRKDRCLLERNTGVVVWITDDPSLDEEVQRRVQNEPNRYVELKPMNHDEHHSLLRIFLQSDWTDNESQKADAIKAYGAQSIGLWKKLVGPETWNEFESASESLLLELLRLRLLSLGFEFQIAGAADK